MGSQHSAWKILESFQCKNSQGILKYYDENISRKKSRSPDESFFPFFCCFQQKLKFQQLLSDSFTNHTTCCTYEAVFFSRNIKCNLEE